MQEQEQTQCYYECQGGGTNRGIYIQSTNAELIHLAYVDNNFKENFSLLPNRWNYIGLQYDMSTGTWSGRVYVDGVAVTALHTDSQSAETTGGLFLWRYYKWPEYLFCSNYCL